MSKLLSLVLMFSIWVILSAATPPIPAVNYNVAMATTNKTALARFKYEVGVTYTKKIMAESTNLILNAFDRVYNNSVTQVDLYIVDMADASVEANTIGDKINVSASYIAGFQGFLKAEFHGMVYSQMTRVWQQNGKGKARGYVLNGIADFMRLKACLVTSDWAMPGGGKSLSENSTVTARFFDYWDYTMKGYVSNLNSKMATGYKDSFLTDGTGLDMKSMWYYYKSNASRVLNYKCGHK